MVGNLMGGALCDLLSNRFGLRVGRRLVGAASLALAGCLLFLASSTSELWLRGAAAGLGYGVLDCMLPASWANCVDIGGPYAGSLSGAMNTSVQAGGFVSIVLFGYMVEHFHSYDAPLRAVAAMTCLSAVFFACIDPTKPLVKATCD
jgi:MFS family permease